MKTAGYFSVIGIAGGLTWYSIRDVSSILYNKIYKILLPVAFLLDPEDAHHAVMWAAVKGLLPIDYKKDNPTLSQSIAGINFSNPVGLAAGFDKDAQAPTAFLSMGFGFVEIGSVTPEPQSGNPKPRIFRLVADKAVINRCGFNSEGHDIVENRLKELRHRQQCLSLHTKGIIGLNFGVNKTSTDKVNDFCKGIKILGKYADYIVINISSPNTVGLRDMQSKHILHTLINKVKYEISSLYQNDSTNSSAATSSGSSSSSSSSKAPPPLFVKISPDSTVEERREIASVVAECNVDGIVISNTTISRPDTLKSESKVETGGLSGAPLKDISTQCVKDMYIFTNGKIPIIAVGGVSTGDDALEKIEAGASLIQVYTSFIYEGPSVARNINDRLSYLLSIKGYNNIKDAIGATHHTKSL
eukprot:GHVR01177123.1.p1 GENE.GHVR01177123.1~~GHVR01177123.1.p1  ORF type:complete len:460 (+),score=101.79 GHVR01177123.1:136-1380(+)